MTVDQLEHAFLSIYKQPLQHLYFCPGRVNLIGEHIDYNGGLVMPCTIDMGTWLMIAPNNTNSLNFTSLNFDERGEIIISEHYSKNNTHWYNYPLGVLKFMADDGHALPSGFDFLYYGNLPVGSGLSSSASIEMVTASALNNLLNAGYSKTELVRLTQKVENKFIGVSSGVMDQFAVAYGHKNKAIELDCETLEYSLIDINLKEHVLAVINTNKPRNLAESKYNERVSECRQALQQLQQELAIKNLCEVSPVQFEQYGYLVTDAVVYNRAKHVVEENERVKKAATALNGGNINAFGELMYQSHYSLKDLYEVSGIELDTIVEFCKEKNIIGARMTGAGFGGCAIALVKETDFEHFKRDITAYYLQNIGYAPSVYATAVTDGVHNVGKL